MFITDIILLAYLAFRNSVRAKLKGLNGWLWAGITIVSYVAALLVGYMVVVFNFCADKVNLSSLSTLDPKQRAEVSKQLAEAVATNPLHVFTIEFFGIGGYLLIRYILERKPNKKQPEVHWMDRLGENR